MPARLAAGLYCVLVSHLLTANALTLQDLQSDAQLTPARLMEYFSDFKFQLRSNLQKPADFLASKCGDCDDFANLTALVLKARGYTPRICVVSMDKATHVVCFVAETQCYLDYNHRQDRLLIPSTGTLADIAQKVASSFQSRWYSVSEVRFAEGVRRFVRTEFP
jgi:hypothetical protein